MLVMPRTPTKSETAMQCGWLFGAVHARLFRDLAIAHAVGSLRSLLARLSRIDVLVIDAWAMAPLAETDAATRCARTGASPAEKWKAFTRNQCAGMSFGALSS